MPQSTCRACTRRALLPASIARFRQGSGSSVSGENSSPTSVSGHGVAPIAFENGGPPGHAAYQRVSSRKGRDEARRGNRRHTGCAESAAPWLEAQGLSCPFPLEENSRPPLSIKSVAKAQNRKPGGGLPGHLRDVSAVRIHQRRNSASQHALRYSLSSFSAEEGRRLGSATFSPVRPVAASITAVFLHAKLPNPRISTRPPSRERSFMLSTNVLTTRSPHRRMLA